MSNFDERPLAPGGPGNAATVGVAAGATSAATAFRTLGAAGGFVINNFAAYVSCKAYSSTAGDGYHIVFGDANVGAPTNADMSINDVDGWVRVLVPANATHFRIKSDSLSAGDVSVYLS